MVITANVEKCTKLFDKEIYKIHWNEIMQNFSLILSIAEDDNSDTSKVLYTVSANLVEICDSLGNLDFASKENNGNSKHHINIMKFSKDIIYTATLAHGDLVALTLCCTIFQEQQT